MSIRLDAQPASSHESSATPRRAWVALAVLILPVLLIAVDNTILAFALPSIAQDFRPAASTQLWIVDVYSLILAALLVMMGSLGDRIGRRRLLLIGAGDLGLVAVIYAKKRSEVVSAHARVGHQCLILTLLC